MRTLIPHTENSFCRSSSGSAAVVVVVPVEEEDEEIDWINSWLLPFVGTQKRSWLAGWPCWFDRWQYSSHRSIPFRSIMAHLLLAACLLWCGPCRRHYIIYIVAWMVSGMVHGNFTCVAIRLGRLVVRLLCSLTSSSSSSPSSFHTQSSKD